MISVSSTRRRLLLGAAGVGLTLLVVYLAFGGAAPARLEAVEPADGTSVVASPTRVSLRFNTAPHPRVMHLTVVGPAGEKVSSGDPVLNDNLISVPVSASRPGPYQVGYHVELDDGTPVAGIATFTVGQGAPTTAGPVEAAGAAHEHHLERDTSTLVLVLIDLVLVAGLVSVLLRRPRVR
ncbi:copper resistance CopC family protein [Micromonospora schwarzwaldensis]|uniref:copper resistance CopC family protein n=1 Tax=Micromonospora sp. DSM 45708 TaxID=3111767 RepID=UPI0031D20027